MLADWFLDCFSGALAAGSVSEVRCCRCKCADATETDNRLFLIRDEFLEWSLRRLAELLLAPVFVRRMFRRGLSALNPEAEALHRTVHSYGKRALN